MLENPLEKRLYLYPCCPNVQVKDRGIEYPGYAKQADEESGLGTPP